MKKIHFWFKSLLFITSAMASAQVFAAATPSQPSMGEALSHMLPMFVIFIGIFYFLLIRPQNKKNKDHKALISSVKAGDEVCTIGGIVATISSISDNYAVLSLNNGSELVLQLSSIASVLPKGTLSTIK